MERPPREARDGEAWTGRHALRDCSDTPVLLSFTPLAFLEGRGATLLAIAGRPAYWERAEIAHTDIAGFVMDALKQLGESTAGM